MSSNCSTKCHKTKEGYLLGVENGVVVLPKVGSKVKRIGSTIIDMFGGIALGSLDAMLHGCNWVGIEIEPRFVLYANGGECDGIVKTEKEGNGATYKGWYLVVQADDEDRDEEAPPAAYVCKDGAIVYVTDDVSIPGLDGFASKEEAEDFLAGFDTEVTDVSVEYREFQHGKLRTIAALCGKKTAHEPHHIQGNFELWEEKYASRMPRWAHGVLLEGDSRNLVNILRDNADKLTWMAAVDGADSSPPYSPDGLGHRGGYPEFAETKGLHARMNDNRYGEADGQLSQMSERNFDASLASPPFIAQSGGTNVTAETGPLADEALLRRHSAGNIATQAYGKADANLGNMPGKDFDGALSSPPYMDTPIEQTHMTSNKRDDPTHPSYRPSWVEKFKDGYMESTRPYGETEGQLGRMESKNFDGALSSHPYDDTPVPKYMSNPGGGIAGRNSANIKANEWRENKGYGDAPGQIGATMDAGVSSPPYAEARIEGQGDEGSSGLRNEDGSFVRGSEGWKLRKEMGNRYGEQQGNLGNLRNNEFDGSLSSPPFEDVTSDRPSKSIVASGLKMGQSSMGDGYGDTEGNIGSQSGDDFWMASRKILENLLVVLRDGAYAAFIVKRYVKGGKIEPFPAKWAMLCEAVGFKIVEWHRAWVIEDRGAQYDIFGNLIRKTVARKSFFA